MKIFNRLGGVSQQVVGNNNTAFITLSKVGGKSFLLARAPVTGVDVQQITDFSITKSLDYDFLVTTFGDTPTKIEIQGISFFNLNGCELNPSSDAAHQQIMTFYDKNKISANLTARFDVAIAPVSKSKVSVFRCVIVGLRVGNNAGRQEGPNVSYTYTLSLVGVKK